ncbi:uncharacterized protein LOC106151205 [Lingula anatina]|uniref:Uncharacterized protein LOC106151205 n=1 Tax=Lingula anatina TaxID=7574 RepID=A0A1S3H3R4_LINAN|nr:uncharacterized protein LOC106151205 [Lingula anatina]|eukprot:XP_013379779.1 uncharacterized protein LOC106151205 [Lingula anatina]
MEAGSSPQDIHRDLIMWLNDRITESQLKNIKYYLQDELGEGKLEKVQDFLDLANILEDICKISVAKYSYLKKILKAANAEKLVKKVEEREREIMKKRNKKTSEGPPNYQQEFSYERQDEPTASTSKQESTDSTKSPEQGLRSHQLKGAGQENDKTWETIVRGRFHKNYAKRLLFRHENDLADIYSLLGELKDSMKFCEDFEIIFAHYLKLLDKELEKNGVESENYIRSHVTGTTESIQDKLEIHKTLIDMKGKLEKCLFERIKVAVADKYPLSPEEFKLLKEKYPTEQLCPPDPKLKNKSKIYALLHQVFSNPTDPTGLDLKAPTELEFDMTGRMEPTHDKKRIYRCGEMKRKLSNHYGEAKKQFRRRLKLMAFIWSCAGLTITDAICTVYYQTGPDDRTQQAEEEDIYYTFEHVDGVPCIKFYEKEQKDGKKIKVSINKEKIE